MINKSITVAVCSRSFTKNIYLKEKLKKKYKYVYFNNTNKTLKGKDLVKFLKNADKAIIGLEKIDQILIDQIPKLKVISKYGVGLNNIDLKYLKIKKIKFGWEPGVNKRSVSELALFNMINLRRKLFLNNQSISNYQWKQHVGSILTGSKIGIIGCGNIGKDLIHLLQPFNCKIFVNDIVNYNKFYKKYKIIKKSINELLKVSDIVSIHVPLNKSSKNLINKNNLKYLKTSSIIINTSRGGIVNEEDLFKFLSKNKLSVALDVYSKEPNFDKRFIKLNNFIGTPHIGGSSKEAIVAMGLSAIKGLTKNSVPSKYMVNCYS